MERTARSRMVRHALGALLALTPAAVLAQQTGAVLLRDGVIVDPAANTAYVAAPDQNVRAVDLATGAPRWSSANAAKPLALLGNRVLAQVEPTASTQNRLELAVLSSRQGTVIRRATRALPAGVRASVGETLRGTFRALARPEDGTALVTWEYRPAFPRGVVPRGEDEAEAERDVRAPAPAAARAAGAINRGTLRINMTSGAVQSLAAAAPGTAPAPAVSLRVLTAQERARLPALPPDQPAYVSADGLHVVVSQRVANDTTWNKYRWTVHELASGQRLGELQMHLSIAPFLVRNSQIVFTTTPFVHRDLGEQPAKLRAFDLATGREAWGVELRDLEYRGPLPP